MAEVPDKRLGDGTEELLAKIEKIEREFRDFAHIISHDLKAPLRGIKSLVEWITTDYADKLDENG